MYETGIELLPIIVKLLELLFETIGGICVLFCAGIGTGVGVGTGVGIGVEFIDLLLEVEFAFIVGLLVLL